MSSVLYAIAEDLHPETAICTVKQVSSVHVTRLELTLSLVLSQVAEVLEPGKLLQNRMNCVVDFFLNSTGHVIEHLLDMIGQVVLFLLKPFVAVTILLARFLKQLETAPEVLLHGSEAIAQLLHARYQLAPNS